MRSSFRTLALGLALVAAGCGDSGPPVYPVKGKVVFKGKGNMRQLVGGMVRFQATSDPKLTPVGEIEDGGVFTLGTVMDTKGRPGVPAGTYKARVEPRRFDGEEPARGAIHPKYQDFDQSKLSFTVPVSGEIVIEVEAP